MKHTKILIVKMSALGDIVNSLPVLDYLHQVVPGVEVDWLVEEPFREVLEGNPLIRRLHLFRTKAWRKRPLSITTLREISAVKRGLQENSYDMVFDIQGNLKSGLACWLSGADNVIGFAREDLQESVNSIFTTRKVHLRGLDRHVTEKYLRVVSAPFGRDFREMSLCSDIYTGADEDAVADALMSTLSDGFVFLFHYGTTWQTKFWSPEGWIELARMLLERFPDSTVLLSWGNEKERKAVTSIASGIGRGARVMDRYGLKGFAAILKRVDVVVGGDTGPVHIAAAVGTPTVSLYRSSDGRSSGPRGERHHVLQSPLSCTRCFKTRCSRDEECRASITAKPLADAVEKLLLQ